MILVLVSLAELMILVDATIINVALPSAQRALHFSSANREWVITAYVLAFGSLLPLGGRLADLFGRKAMFIAGTVGFGAMSALAGASPNFTTLLIARTLQGVSAAILAPAALSVIPVTFTDTSERNRGIRRLRSGRRKLRRPRPPPRRHLDELRKLALDDVRQRRLCRACHLRCALVDDERAESSEAPTRHHWHAPRLWWSLPRCLWVREGGA